MKTKFILLIVLCTLLTSEASAQFYRVVFVRKQAGTVNIPFLRTESYNNVYNGCVGGIDYAIRVGTMNYASGFPFTNANVVGTYDFDAYSRSWGSIHDGFFGCTAPSTSAWTSVNPTSLRIRVVVEDPLVSSLPTQCYDSTPISIDGATIRNTVTGYNSGSTAGFNLDPKAPQPSEGTFYTKFEVGGSATDFGFFSSILGFHSVTINRRTYQGGEKHQANTGQTWINGPVTLSILIAQKPVGLVITTPDEVCADAAGINLSANFTSTTGGTESFSCLGGNCGSAMFYTSGGDTYFKPDWNGTSSSYTATIAYTVTTPLGCASVATKVIKVGAGYTLDAGANVPVCKNGSNINLNTGASNSAGGGAVTSWSGTAVTGNTFNINDAAAVAGQSYTMTYQVDNTTGCVKTDTKSVTVNAVPAVPSVAPATAVICSGNDITLTAGGAAGATYRWYNSGGTYLNVENANFTSPALSTNTTYQVASRITATGCESAKVSKVVTVNPTPVQPTNITTSPSSPACGATNFTLTGVGATAGEEYRWYSSSDALLGSGVNFATTTLGVGTHTFKATKRNTTTGCESTLRSITLTVQNSPSVTTTHDTRETCSGNGSINLNTFFGSSPTTGTWSSTNSTVNGKITGASLNLTGVTPGVYPLRYSVTSGCTSVKDLSLIVSSGATTPVVNDTKLCEPGIANLSVVSPSGSFQYRWFASASGGTAINTGTNYTTPFLTNTATYYIEAENTGTGCVSTRDAALVTVVNIGEVNAGDDVGFCSNSGVSVNLASDATPLGGTFSGVGVSGNTFNGSPLANNASYVVTYTVINNGCSKEDTRTISLGFNVTLKLNGQTVPEVGNEVFVEDLTVIEHNYPNATQTLWEFGDGWKLNGLKGSHYYYTVGDMNVKVKITQPGGCSNEFEFPAFITAKLEHDIITGADDPLTVIKETTAYPMPFSGVLSLNAKASLGTVKIALIRMDGANALQKSMLINAGDNLVFDQTETASIPAGVYVLKLQGANKSVQNIKVIKK